MVVMPVHIVKEAPHGLAEGIIKDDYGAASSMPMGFRLLEPMLDAAAIDRVLPPGSLRKKARDVRLVRAVEDAARNIGYALVGQDDEPGQIVLEMLKLAVTCFRYPTRAKALWDLPVVWAQPGPARATRSPAVQPPA